MREKTRFAMVFALALWSTSAVAQVAAECEDFEGPPPAGYDDGVQQDFLLNYFALSSTFSPVHGPIPHEPGRGSIGVDLAVIPPLGCEKRFVLNHTKTENTNFAPLIPRPTVSVALPAIGPARPYIGFAYVPPVKVFGTTNVIVSGEAGVGFALGDTFQLGGRYHATLHKTVAEIATPFEEGDPAFDDLFIASTFGLDLIAGAALGEEKTYVPYVAFGFTDASTFFYIGDDGFLTNNLHPYFGPNFSVGLDGLVANRFRFGAEFYGAPGGYSLPDKDVSSVDKGSRYGSLYTGRIRLAVEI